jgi:hypothetical protein
MKRRVTGIVAVFVFCTAVLALVSNVYADPGSSAGRFISNNDGTVVDTRTGLMWAANDNGAKVTWQEAKEYCEKFRGGGYADWRMPTVKELAGLYDKHEPGYRPECAIYNWKVYLTDSIKLTGASCWAAEAKGNQAKCFMFDYGCRSLMFKSVDFIMRALPVRNCLVN